MRPRALPCRTYHGPDRLAPAVAVPSTGSPASLFPRAAITANQPVDGTASTPTIDARHRTSASSALRHTRLIVRPTRRLVCRRQDDAHWPSSRGRHTADQPAHGTGRGGTRRDGTGQDGTRRDRTGRGRMGRDRVGWDGMATGWDRTGPDGTGPDGTGWDRTGWDRLGPRRAAAPGGRHQFCRARPRRSVAGAGDRRPADRLMRAALRRAACIGRVALSTGRHHGVRAARPNLRLSRRRLCP